MLDKRFIIYNIVLEDMEFKELLELPHQNEIIDLASLVSKLPSTPNEVLAQFYSDHGRKDTFQSQYRSLTLNNIIWVKKRLKAESILEYNSISEFNSRINAVKNRVNNFKSDSRDCIDSRKEVIEFWKDNGTWRTPPILIDGTLVGSNSKLWLVEGHTRIGVLMWLIEYNIISKDSYHDIWFGRYN